MNLFNQVTALFPSKECWAKRPSLNFEKMVYWLNYKPKHPDVSNFCNFSIIPMR